MKKSAKRFTTAEAIEQDIDATLAAQRENAIAAEKLEDAAQLLYRRLPPEPTTVEGQQNYNAIKHEADAIKEQAAALRQKHSRYATRLERLKQTLAAFNTVAMPLIPDNSVLLQPDKRTSQMK